MWFGGELFDVKAVFDEEFFEFRGGLGEPVGDASFGSEDAFELT